MTIQTFLGNFASFIGETLIPFILAIAFLFFIWNVFKYFILHSDSEDGRTKARQSALWGIIAFVVILSIWGIVNLFVDGAGFDNKPPLTPDYIEQKTPAT